jgi:cysteine desulfurase
MTEPYIYLDHAAATPLDEDVFKFMKPYFSIEFFNPSATYLPAVRSKQALDRARIRVAFWLGAKPSEIIFTAGASEANNLAIQGLMRQYPEANMLYSAIEHESVIAPANIYNSKSIKVHSDGRLDLDDLSKKIDSQTVLVSVIYASNEIGTIEPLHEISKIIEEVKIDRLKSGNKLPIYFHSDATQAANYLDLHTSRLGLDLMSLNGGKIYGPKQSGALFIKSGVLLSPIVYGGGQERGLRSGTESLVNAIGLSSALNLVQTDRHEEARRVKSLNDQLIKLIEDKIPDIQVNGSRKYRLPNNVHLTIPGQDNERLLLLLEQNSILAAAGSACNASNDEPSHVLKAIGKSDAEAQASIRLSLGRITSEEDIKKTAEVLIALTSVNK